MKLVCTLSITLRPGCGAIRSWPVTGLSSVGLLSAVVVSRLYGVETIGDLISKTEAELSAIPNFGKKSIEEVKENLAAHGLGLRSDDD